MAWRQSIQIPPLGHQNPIPFASKVGNMFFTGLIVGRDAETNQVPEDAVEQARNCFRNLQRALEKAGGTMGDVAHVAALIKEEGVRPKLNVAWLEFFPNEEDRPARHTQVDPNMNSQVTIEVIAVLQNG
jgi:enamine deaminase RidA (YjgF/YER057c/UK114 family)